MRLFKAALAAITGVLCAGLAAAGGPLGIDSDGTPFAWSTATAIQYRTDNGPLSATVTQSVAQSRVRGMFDAWQDVASASIRYNRAGFIQNTSGFSDGDVSTAAEFNAVEGSCFDGDQSPIVYDVDGSLFEDLGEDSSVIGFAGPCAIDANGHYFAGRAVMNGRFQDGIDTAANLELTTAEFNAAFIHEFGHFSGLDHSQINVECASTACGTDNLAGLPTMFPFLVSDQQATLSIDDVAWISKLYPAGGGGGFNATHGTIRGTVYFSDGESQVQFANVVARRVDTGGNEDRRLAASVVSGYRFRVCHPNPITNPPPSDCGTSGSDTASHIGLYEIPLPPGNYTIEVESINPQFTSGSSLGPSDFPIPLPVAPPAPIGPITVTAGQTSSGNDVTLIGTPPRFDAFEGP